MWAGYHMHNGTKRAISFKILTSFNTGAHVCMYNICRQCMSFEHTVPDYCHVNTTGFSETSSHSQTAALTTLRHLSGCKKYLCLLTQGSYEPSGEAAKSVLSQITRVQ